MTSTSDERTKPVIVIGSGNFGTCLAQHLANKKIHVALWCRSPGVAEEINRTRRNPKYVSAHLLSENITATADFAALPWVDAQFIIMATPTQFLRHAFLSLRPLLKTNSRLILANKGIECDSLALPLDIVGEILGQEVTNRTAVLSGPSFASEIMDGQPTAVAVASYDPAVSLAAQELLHAPHFRTYTSDDPIGLEVAGAIKNVIAIASGGCSGLGLQQNSRAALLTRGLAEITRFGVALGANPLTFTGLGGVGDLFLTCTSEKSRNFTVGFRLGRGEALADILATMGSVAEGVETARAARSLASKLGIDAPITEQVYQVLYEGKAIADAFRALIVREAKPELSLPQERK